MVIVPVLEPLDLGLKLTDRLQSSCFFNARLHVLLCVKSLDELMLEMTSAAFPELETVTTWAALVELTVTVPNETSVLEREREGVVLASSAVGNTRIPR